MASTLRERLMDMESWCARAKSDGLLVDLDPVRLSETIDSINRIVDAVRVANGLISSALECSRPHDPEQIAEWAYHAGELQGYLYAISDVLEPIKEATRDGE